MLSNFQVKVYYPPSFDFQLLSTKKVAICTQITTFPMNLKNKTDMHIITKNKKSVKYNYLLFRILVTNALTVSAV